MLSLIAAPFTFFVCFLVQQKIQQHHMLERLENASLQTISINKTDIVWVKKNKEVIIDGKLFDIKSYSILNDKVIFIGLFDKDEDAIKKNYADKILSGKNESTPLSQLLLKCMFAFNVHESYLDELKYCLLSKVGKKYFLFSQKSISQYLSVSIPPPNV